MRRRSVTTTYADASHASRTPRSLLIRRFSTWSAPSVRSFGATPAQVSLAWLDAKGRQYGLPSVSIPGTRFAARVTENAGALDIVLSEDQIARLDSLAAITEGFRSADLNWVSQGRE